MAKKKYVVSVEDIEKYCAERVSEFSKLEISPDNNEAVGEMYGYGNVWHFIQGNAPTTYESAKGK